MNRMRTGCPINVMYSPSYSFFDAMINMTTDHGIVPMIFTKNSNHYIDHTNYSALWLNDIINFSQRIPEYSHFYTSYILAIHDYPSPNMKKEDILILRKNLNKYKFISFLKDNTEWPFDNITTIPYGVPICDSNISKSKDILIINIKKQKQTHVLYQYIKQKYPATDITDSNPIDMSQIHTLLSNYKICIDLDSYYNLLVANSCGAYGITANANRGDEFIFSVKEINEIFDIIPKLLSIHDSNSIIQKTSVNYNWTEFKDHIKKYTQNLYKEGFVI